MFAGIDVGSFHFWPGSRHQCRGHFIGVDADGIELIGPALYLLDCGRDEGRGRFKADQIAVGCAVGQ